ncbi:MAG: hypothetical protein LiPW41_477 [Parcubacteria group bacterium LiPW_41]|nr:MAG: hypothetical protein LiPW41_477 [Parcubacteria group bacterium LiPW_41]
MEPNTMVLVALIVAVIYLVSRKPKQTVRADYNSILAFIKLRKNRGKEVTAETLEDFDETCTAMHVEATYREEAAYLAKKLPQDVSKFKNQAQKAAALWNKLGKLAKTLSIIAGIVIFGLLYTMWGNEFLEMMRTSWEFLVSVVKASPLVIAGVVFFLVLK